MHHVIYETEYKVANKSGTTSLHKVAMLQIIKYIKTIGIDYNSKPILDNIKEFGDLHSFSCIFHTIEMVYFIINKLSQTMDSHKEILITGCYILGLTGFQMKIGNENVKSLQDLFNINYLNGFGMLSFRHLAAFSRFAKTELPELLKSFGNILNSFLGDHILRLLLPDIDVSSNRVKESGIGVITDNISQTMEKIEKDIEHPEYLWNKTNRTEFNTAIMYQYKFKHTE